jgi:hypothetical protein
VVTFSKGPKHRTKLYHYFVGRLGRLDFDIGRWAWKNGLPLHRYSAALGRQLIHPRPMLEKATATKWRGVLPTNYQPPWSHIWDKRRPAKDAAFMWSLMHGAVAVNARRSEIFPNTPSTCDCCLVGTPETLIHCFHDCTLASHAWLYAQSITCEYLQLPQTNGAWPNFTWQECILGTKLPRRFANATLLWSLLRGSVLWLIWLARNSTVFQALPWPPEKIDALI